MLILWESELKMEKIIDNCKLLFDYFGWYALLLVAGVTLLMIPINLLYKKIMASDGLQRLRKTIVSPVTVYGLSLGFVALFTATIIKVPLTADYLFNATLPCMVLSMFLWAIIKIIKDYGFAPIIKAIANNRQAQKWISDLGLNKSVVDLIVKNINKYLAETDTKSVDDVIAKSNEIDNLIRQHLGGFVSGDMTIAIDNIMDIVKKGYPSKKEEVNKVEQAIEVKVDEVQQ